MIMPTTDPDQPWVLLTSQLRCQPGKLGPRDVPRRSRDFSRTPSRTSSRRVPGRLFIPYTASDYSAATGGVYVDLAAQFTEHAPARRGWAGGPGSVTPVSTDQLSGIQTVTGSSFDDLLVGGTLSGNLSGGAGNDLILRQGTSQAYANNASWLTLDGGAGSNALYGSSGFNTFLVGDTNGGFNQIWGPPRRWPGCPAIPTTRFPSRPWRLARASTSTS